MKDAQKQCNRTGEVAKTLGHREHWLAACCAWLLVLLFTQQRSLGSECAQKMALGCIANGREAQQIDVTQQMEYTEQITALLRPFSDQFEGCWPLTSKLLLPCKEHRQVVRRLSKGSALPCLKP